MQPSFNFFKQLNNDYSLGNINIVFNKFKKIEKPDFPRTCNCIDETLILALDPKILHYLLKYVFPGLQPDQVEILNKLLLSRLLNIFVKIDDLLENEI